MENGVGGKSLYFSLRVFTSYSLLPTSIRIWQEMIDFLANSWQGSNLSMVELVVIRGFFSG
jgi:hypothetical protein